jgi:CDP-diglyceride synthetase
MAGISSPFFCFSFFHHVLNAVSPNKSVVGLMGGIVAGTLTYVTLPWFWFLLHHYSIVDISAAYNSNDMIAQGQQQTPPWFYYQRFVVAAAGNDASYLPISTSATIVTPWVVGLIISISAVAGDLVESAFKRIYHVKDTGSWLPAHGGALDRFDSTLLIVGLFHYYVSTNSHQY